jgi:phosphate transport system permease protein
LNLRRKVIDKLWLGLALVALVLALAPLASIIYYVTARGISSISWSFLTQNPSPTGVGGGIANALQGSFIVIALASAIGIPIGLLSGVYVSEFGNGWYAQSIRFLADVLAGIPSIVTGIFVYALVVLSLHGFSALAGGVALGFIEIPIISNTTGEALKLVPNSLREASAALGIRKWRTIILMMANSVSGIVTGILLATARALGETAPMLLTAFGSYSSSTGLFNPIMVMPLLIFQNAVSGTPSLVDQAWGASFILLITVLGINILVRLATRGRIHYAQ